MKPILAATLAIAACASLPSPARAEIQNCINITSLPAVVSTQGVYCLKQDLATTITSGSAIEITTNNVTIDCNGFKLGGLGAGPATQAVGIGALSRSNITIRNCNVRGFYIGVGLSYGGDPGVGPSGNVVEDNRVEKSTRTGIYLAGDSSVVRRNLVFATGLNSGGEPPVGIEAHMSVDIVDNTVDGVVQTPGSVAQATGILTWYNVGGTVANNRIRDLQSTYGGTGIFNTFSSVNMLIRGNIIGGTGPFNIAPVQCVQLANLAVDNAALGFGEVAPGCTDGGGNVNNYEM